MPGAVNAFVEPFDTLLDTAPSHRKLVTVKVPSGMVDMFGRAYPRRVMLWVHHYDDFGVFVEGTYEIVLGRKALKKAGYDVVDLWGWRPTLTGQEERAWPLGQAGGGRPGLAFYFDVEAAGA